ncbi:MAG: hypothetical protein QNK37_16330 [Acidobacteriota bacterium]|nr:hypothetical protein [Acidobacteriota bacterium]
MSEKLKLLGGQLLQRLLPDELQGTVGDGGGTYLDETEDFSKEFTIGEYGIDTGGNITAKAGTLAKDSGIKPYGDEEIKAPDSQRIAYLTVDLGAEAGGDASVSQGIATLSGELDSNASASFARYDLVSPDDENLEVATDLIKDFEIPGTIDLKDLKDEIIVYAYKMEMDLGLSLTLGYEKNFEEQIKFLEDLFEDAGTSGLEPLTAEVKADLKAGLGFSLADNFQLTIGNVWDKPGWVRFRVSRKNEKKMSFSAEFNLSVSYDLGSGLESILDNVLELDAVQKVRGYMTEVADKLKDIGDLTVDDLKTKLDDKIVTYIRDDLGLDSFIQNSADLAKVVKYADQVVQAYDGIDERLESLWNDLLLKADLGEDSKARRELTKITQLDTSSGDAFFTQVLGSDYTDAVELLETLIGNSVEDLVTKAWEEVEPLVTKAKKYAQQAVDFLNNAPTDVAEKIYAYARKTGVAGVVDWLRENATSVDAVQNAADEAVAKTVSKLTGKLIDKINLDDVKKVQAWAVKIAAKIDDINDFDTKLREKLQKLNGDLGVNMTLEMARSTSREALLDIELETADNGIENAWKASQGVHLNALLANLPDPDDDDDNELPYLIRECAFTTTRIRSSAWGLMLSGILNLEKETKSIRTSSATVQISQDGDTITRTGEFSGSLIRGIKVKDSYDWSGGLALVGSGKDTGETNPNEPFSNLSYLLRLTTERTDQNTTQAEIADIGRLLQKMGFLPDGTGIPAGFTPGCISKLAVKIDAGGDMAQAFFAAGPWEETGAAGSVYLPAGKHWIEYGVDQSTDPPIASALVSFMDSSEYTNLFPGHARELNGMQFPLPGTPNGIRNLRQGEAFAAVKLSERAVKGPEKFAGISLPASAERGAIFDLVTRFATASKRANVTQWPSPLFIYWLVRERLEQLGKWDTSHIKGLATLRFLDDTQKVLGSHAWTIGQSS